MHTDQPLAAIPDGPYATAAKQQEHNRPPNPMSWLQELREYKLQLLQHTEPPHQPYDDTAAVEIDVTTYWLNHFTVI